MDIGYIIKDRPLELGELAFGPEYPDGYQLSSFKRIVSEYRFHIKVVGHVEHYAAEQMYIDFAGDRLEVVDEMTGETKKAEVFVAILPFSHYTYCEAVWSQARKT